MSSNAQRRPVRKRVRLTPDIRIGLILDAALAEFSRNGFAATRIEDIAAHAGLSKAGLYAHFASKEAIFEALLVRTLSLPISTPPPELEMARQRWTCTCPASSTGFTSASTPRPRRPRCAC